MTSWPLDKLAGPALLEHYRRRGYAEAHMGELMSVLEPALSSSPRAKTHYRGQALQTRAVPVDSFAFLRLNSPISGLLYVTVSVYQEGTCQLILGQVGGQILLDATELVRGQSIVRWGVSGLDRGPV